MKSTAWLFSLVVLELWIVEGKLLWPLYFHLLGTTCSRQLEGSWICYAGGVPCILQNRNCSLVVCALGVIHVTVTFTDPSMRFINTDLGLLLDFDAVGALLSSSAVSLVSEQNFEKPSEKQTTQNEKKPRASTTNIKIVAICIFPGITCTFLEVNKILSVTLWILCNLFSTVQHRK